MSTQALQQIITPGRTRDLPTSFQRQPGRVPRRRPGGIEAGLAATVLAALSLLSILGYGIASAIATQNGYAAMALRREIEDLRAEEALLRYQVNLGQSKVRILQAADRLDLHLADPVQEVDYVVLPSAEGGREVETASEGSGDEGTALSALLRAVTNDLVGRAEASTLESRR